MSTPGNEALEVAGRLLSAEDRYYMAALIDLGRVLEMTNPVALRKLLDLARELCARELGTTPVEDIDTTTRMVKRREPWDVLER